MSFGQLGLQLQLQALQVLKGSAGGPDCTRIEPAAYTCVRAFGHLGLLARHNRREAVSSHRCSRSRPSMPHIFAFVAQSSSRKQRPAAAQTIRKKFEEKQKARFPVKKTSLHGTTQLLRISHHSPQPPPLRAQRLRPRWKTN